MAALYSYIPVGDKHFCSDGNLVALGWILALNNRRLHLDTLGVQFHQIPRILKTLFRQRGKVNEATAGRLALPTFGHLCLRVHRGYKLFDLSSRTATKIFDNDMDAAARAVEINAVREAAKLDFAPDLLAVDSDNRWYREAYMPGRRGSKTVQSDPARVFRETIADHLCQMTAIRPIETISAGEYLGKLLDTLTEDLADFRCDELRNEVHDFVAEIAAQLQKTPDLPIHRIFSHGDFSFVNFIYNENRVIVIDWESLQTRSLLSDFYNYFLTELYYQRSRTNLVAEINDALVLLSRKLAPEAPLLADDVITHKAIYRWFYYLERMHMLLSRDMSDNQLNVIRRSMGIFNEHESTIRQIAP
ncbi:MAG: phosphotransferase [Thiogranum sp.]|nr:phosphotransferase [Thiogranum sp.]